MLKIAGLLLISVFGVVVMVSSTINGATKKKSLTSILLKILMNHMQILLLIYAFNFNWPENVKRLFDLQKPAAQVVTQFLSVECFIQDTLSDPSLHIIQLIELLEYSLLPFIIITLCYLFWILKSLIQSCKNFSSMNSKSISTIIIILYLVHPFIVKTMMDSLNCIQIEGKYYLMKRTAIQCYSGQHMYWIVIIILPTLLIWGIGTPVFMILILLKHRKELGEDMVKQKYGFLYNGYQEKRYYWEGLMMLKKITVILIQVQLFFMSTKMQAYLLLLLQFISLIFTSTLKPFQMKFLNQIEVASHLVAIISVYAGVIYLTIDSITPEGFMILFVLILSFNILFTIIWVRVFIKEIWKSFKTGFTKLYLILNIFGNKSIKQEHVDQLKIQDESLSLRMELEDVFNEVLRAVDKKQLILNQELIKKFKDYMSLDKIQQELVMEERVDMDGAEYQGEEIEVGFVQEEARSIQQVDQLNSSQRNLIDAPIREIQLPPIELKDKQWLKNMEEVT